jgi:hypothetical protein
MKGSMRYTKQAKLNRGGKELGNRNSEDNFSSIRCNLCDRDLTTMASRALGPFAVMEIHGNMHMGKLMRSAYELAQAYSEVDDEARQWCKDYIINRDGLFTVNT